jgi:hypothetical protein
MTEHRVIKIYRAEANLIRVDQVSDEFVEDAIKTTRIVLEQLLYLQV